MGLEDPGFLVVGHISKPHGTKGELFVRSLTDHPEGIYAPGVVLRPGSGDADEPDPDLPPLRVEAARPQRSGFVVSFAGIETRNEAELVRDQNLYVPFEQVAPLEEGEVFFHQLVGLRVETLDGAALGDVDDVLEVQASYMLEVHGADKEYMIPYRPEIVVEVDLDARRLVVDPPEGLLDL